jgi:hypothetical protein
MDSLEGLGDKFKELAGDIWKWIRKNADIIYKIGDWLGYASAACDVLALIFSETVIGAAIFEGIGMALSEGDDLSVKGPSRTLWRTEASGLVMEYRGLNKVYRVEGRDMDLPVLYAQAVLHECDR